VGQFFFEELFMYVLRDSSELDSYQILHIHLIGWAQQGV
jgi:hypothetical protein